MDAGFRQRDESSRGKKRRIHAGNARQIALYPNLPCLKELTGDDGFDGPFVIFDPETGGKDDSEERRQQEQSRRFEHALLKSDMEGRLVAKPFGIVEM